ncbi:solute carrier family 35, member F5 [Trypanosoma grayi]|uniref:solute carrier family 35, member F5 n=1 Tax=Trypanosoma grayi TaxID=71804 RepID=UPI0004F48225|nr:solute carrier family 35, member F5 [Trypanosoma grayi]KEG12183.1 solute carrier family 35, member F5 [Trypanosoma grayi]
MPKSHTEPAVDRQVVPDMANSVGKPLVGPEKPQEPFESSTPYHFHGGSGLAVDYEGGAHEEEEVEEDTGRCCCCFRCRCLKGVSVGKHALGIFLILCVTVIWVASSAWIQYIFGELEYEKPYFLTYFNTGGFALWNLGYLIMPSWRRIPWDNTEKSEPIIFIDHDLKSTYEGPRRLSNDNTPAAQAAAETKVTEEVSLVTVVPRDAETLLPLKASKTLEKLKPYSKLKIFKCACAFCPLWFAANYLFNLSLSRTSIASNTVLSSTSSIWTLLLSFLLLGQRITVIKLGAVVLCVGGSVMIAFADGKSALEGEGVSGDILAVVSAMFYALYTSVLKWFLPDDERFYMGMTFGMVGVINLVCLWPFLPVLNAIEFELFQLPTPQQFWPLVLNTLIGTNLSDVLWARSVVLTSPVIATLGLTLTTPLAMVVDAVWKGAKFAPLYVVGAMCVMVGFIVVNVEDHVSRTCVLRLYNRLRSGPLDQ